MEDPASGPTVPRSFNGINHLKLPCKSIRKTHDFYTQIFPFRPFLQYNHYTLDYKLFALMFMHPSTKPIIEVRYVPSQAEAQKGWDPITFGVGTRSDLEAWSQWLDANGVCHSPIFTGVKGWVMGCEDPNGRIVRLYVRMRMSIGWARFRLIQRNQAETEETVVVRGEMEAWLQGDLVVYLC